MILFHFHNDRKATEHLKRFQDTQVKLSQDTQVSDASNDQDLVSVIATLKIQVVSRIIKE